MSVRVDESRLRARIESAFERTPAPRGEIVSTLIDDEGVSEYFGGRSWRGHAVKDLRYHEAALSFFTADAFRYFLPAFMLASIEDPVEADVIPEGIVYHLANWEDPHGWERMSRFSFEELEAIEAFLWWVADLWSGGSDVERALEGVERAKGMK
jgi:hypothetical protein